MVKRNAANGVRKATQDKRLKFSMQVVAIQRDEAQKEEDATLDAIVIELKTSRWKIMPVWRLMSTDILEMACIDHDEWFTAANPYCHRVPKHFC